MMDAHTTTTDARTDSQKQTMAQFFAEERAEYADSDGYTILHEDDEAVVVADHTGHELNEWADRLSMDREVLRQTMRTLAEQKVGETAAHEAFSNADPVVFDRFEN